MMWTSKRMRGCFSCAGLALFLVGGVACARMPDIAYSEEAGYRLYRMGHYARALEIWERAGKAGDAGATFRLGVEYLDAKIVKRDIPRALAYITRAAKAGDARAQMDLASFYDNGRILPQNLAKAAQWYLAAAERGLPEAQYNIGIMYETGEGGLERDFVRALMFFVLAEKGGFTHFVRPAMEALQRRMTRAEIKRARAQAEDFVLEPLSPSAP